LRSAPFGFDITLAGDWTTQFDNHLERRLSALRGQFSNEEAFRAALSEGDPVIYEVVEMKRPTNSGELLTGVSIVHPGKVGAEYFMTKGHFHAVRDTAEIYYCLRGHGLLMMENAEGEWTSEEFRPGRVVYVAPGWAHRSINLNDREDLMTFFAYPGHAGHDYASIEASGFRKLVLEQNGRPALVDNPSWSR
jgi:glucose-6-phosphate isomerase